MYTILKKRTLGPAIREYEIEAPEVARVARAGQFVVLRLHERGERIPLTVVDCDPVHTGSVTVVVQEVGKSTREMGDGFHEGDHVMDFAGPLGEPSEIEQYGTVICIGGGLGIAPLYPIARALKAAGNHVLTIIGARTHELLFYEDRMRSVSDRLLVVTDDGSYGRKGFVTDALRDVLSEGKPIARVWAIGPAVMMKACAEVTRPEGIPTIVSLNSVMIDGTGMCGGCRVQVGGAARFACVDGPEFDGHQVDFDLLISRQRYYHQEEGCAMEAYLKRDQEASDE